MIFLNCDVRLLVRKVREPNQADHVICHLEVMRLSGEPPRDANQSSALPAIDYNQLTSSKAKETHPKNARNPLAFS